MAAVTPSPDEASRGGAREAPGPQIDEEAGHQEAYAIVSPGMKTSLERRQRYRRNGNGKANRRGRGGATALAIGLPLFLFSTLLFLGVLGLVAAVGAYNFYSQGLADPQQVFSSLTFSAIGTLNSTSFGLTAQTSSMRVTPHSTRRRSVVSMRSATKLSMIRRVV